MTIALIEALQNPALYDHPVSEFQLIETHISWVVLTGDYVYKIKKPVDFGFLDFSTLDQRRHFCDAEVRLNQRLAPKLYEGVLPIYGSEQSPLLTGAGEPIEYAIKMRQFSQEHLLSALQERGSLELEQMQELGDVLAEFHQRTDRAQSDSPWGELAAVQAPVSENFEQIAPFLTDADDLAQLERLQGWANAEFARLQPVFSARKAAGLVRACHGDLHLGNITLIEGRVTLFDCIEFNESFRWTDTMGDLGFLLMDLDARGQERLAHRLRNRYLEVSGDYQGLQVLNFYKAYRALVRAKVALFSIQPEQTESQQQAQWAQYRQYAQLAERYMEPGQPLLAVTFGVSGSGKSTASQQLVDELGLVRVRSDIERKRLFANDKAANTSGQNIYTAEATAQTYERLQQIATELLQAGYAVVLDATYLKHSERQDTCAVAERLKVPRVILQLQASIENIREWIVARQAAGQDASEADVAVMEQQLQWLEPLTDAELEQAWQVSSDVADGYEQMVDHLRSELHR